MKVNSYTVALTVQGLGCLYELWKEEYAGAALAALGMYGTVISAKEGQAEEARRRLLAAQANPSTLDNYIVLAELGQ